MAGTDTEEVYQQYYQTTALVIPLYVITIVVGVIGNGIVIRQYFIDKSIHRIFNFIITHLAVADMIICALFTPLLLVYRSHASAMLVAYSPLCEFALFSSMLAISMQYFLFPLLAFHRKDVMLNPREPKLLFKKAKNFVYGFWATCVAVSAGLVGMAWYIFLHRETGEPKFYRCLLINTGIDAFTLYFLIYSAAQYGMSIMITVYFYYKGLNTKTTGLNASAEERHITKLCFWLAIVYTCCWTPFLVVQVSGIFGRYSEIYFNMHACSSAVGVIGSAINPMIYVFMDPYYKRAFLKFLGACSDNCKVDAAIPHSS
ncbi:neuromedin-U receptor 1 isoform X2 [Nematostella vectensis]|uniref:neuromedin-U receptor 1 isoform X2 n=1 Tax=Nematostella vectensis TaxID=45351 RepID=UPI002076F537|nr:neuromedin-U receptor 1 isoform X2 [Nematostella vectensis]